MTAPPVIEKDRGSLWSAGESPQARPLVGGTRPGMGTVAHRVRFGDQEEYTPPAWSQAIGYQTPSWGAQAPSSRPEPGASAQTGFPIRMNLDLMSDDPLGGVVGPQEADPFMVGLGAMPGAQRGGFYNGLATAPITLANFPTYGREGAIALLTSILGKDYQQPQGAMPGQEPPITGNDPLDLGIFALRQVGNVVNAPFEAASNWWRDSNNFNRAKQVRELAATGTATPFLIDWVVGQVFPGERDKYTLQKLYERAQSEGVDMVGMVSDAFDISPQIAAQILQNPNLSDEQLGQLMAGQPISLDPTVALANEGAFFMGTLAVGAVATGGLAAVARGLGAGATLGAEGLAAVTAPAASTARLGGAIARGSAIPGRVGQAIARGAVEAGAAAPGAGRVLAAGAGLTRGALKANALMTTTGWSIRGLELGIKQAAGMLGNQDVVDMMDRLLWQMPLSMNPGLNLIDGFGFRVTSPMRAARVVAGGRRVGEPLEVSIGSRTRMGGTSYVGGIGINDLGRYVQVGGRTIQLDKGSPASRAIVRLREAEPQVIHARVFQKLGMTFEQVDSALKSRGQTWDDARNMLLYLALQARRIEKGEIGRFEGLDLPDIRSRSEAFWRNNAEEALRIIDDEMSGRSTAITDLIKGQFWTLDKLNDSDMAAVKARNAATFMPQIALSDMISWMAASRTLRDNIAAGRAPDTAVLGFRRTVNLDYLTSFRQHLRDTYQQARDVVSVEDIERLRRFGGNVESVGIGSRLRRVGRKGRTFTRSEIEEILSDIENRTRAQMAGADRGEAAAFRPGRAVGDTFEEARVLGVSTDQLDRIRQARDIPTEELPPPPRSIAEAVARATGRTADEIMAQGPQQAWQTIFEWMDERLAQATDTAFLRDRLLSFEQAVAAIPDEALRGTATRSLRQIHDEVMNPLTPTERLRNPPRAQRWSDALDDAKALVAEIDQHMQKPDRRLSVVGSGDQRWGTTSAIPGQVLVDIDAMARKLAASDSPILTDADRALLSADIHPLSKLDALERSVAGRDMRDLGTILANAGIDGEGGTAAIVGDMRAILGLDESVPVDDVLAQASAAADAYARTTDELAARSRFVADRFRAVDGQLSVETEQLQTRMGVYQTRRSQRGPQYHVLDEDLDPAAQPQRLRQQAVRQAEAEERRAKRALDEANANLGNLGRGPITWVPATDTRGRPIIVGRGAIQRKWPKEAKVAEANRIVNDIRARTGQPAQVNYLGNGVYQIEVGRYGVPEPVPQPVRGTPEYATAQREAQVARSTPAMPFDDVDSALNGLMSETDATAAWDVRLPITKGLPQASEDYLVSLRARIETRQAGVAASEVKPAKAYTDTLDELITAIDAEEAARRQGTTAPVTEAVGEPTVAQPDDAPDAPMPEWMRQNIDAAVRAVTPEVKARVVELSRTNVARDVVATLKAEGIDLGDDALSTVRAIRGEAGIEALGGPGMGMGAGRVIESAPEPAPAAALDEAIARVDAAGTLIDEAVPKWETSAADLRRRNLMTGPPGEAVNVQGGEWVLYDAEGNAVAHAGVALRGERGGVMYLATARKREGLASRLYDAIYQQHGDDFLRAVGGTKMSPEGKAFVASWLRRQRGEVAPEPAPAVAPVPVEGTRRPAWRVDTPEYRKDYNRGWRYSEKPPKAAGDSLLDYADDKGWTDNEAWMDGYLDSAAGRAKYHILEVDGEGRPYVGEGPAPVDDALVPGQPDSIYRGEGPPDPAMPRPSEEEWTAAIMAGRQEMLDQAKSLPAKSKGQREIRAREVADRQRLYDSPVPPVPDNWRAVLHVQHAPHAMPGTHVSIVDEVQRTLRQYERRWMESGSPESPTTASLTTATPQGDPALTGVAAAADAESTLVDPVMDEIVADAAAREAGVQPVESVTMYGGERPFQDPRTETRRTIPARFRVMEADDILTSWDEGYPTDLQPRRVDAGRQSDAARIARRPDERMLEASTGAEGTPVVGPDGVALAGNHRSYGLRSADEGAFEGYRAQLLARAEEFGLDAAEVSRMRRPVLVREVPQEYMTSEMARALNQPTGGMGITELATSISREITADDLIRLDVSETTPISTALGQAKNAEFVQRLLAKLTERQRAEYTTDGVLNLQGRNLITASILSKVLGPENSDVVTRLMEVADSDLGFYGKALTETAGLVAQAERGQTLIGEPLARAMELVMEGRAKPKVVIGEQLADDLTAVSVDPTIQGLASSLADMRSGAEVSEFLRGYADAVPPPVDLNQVSLFADDVVPATPPSLVALLNAGIDRVNANRLAKSRKAAEDSNALWGGGEVVPQIARIPGSDGTTIHATTTTGGTATIAREVPVFGTVDEAIDARAPVIREFAGDDLAAAVRHAPEGPFAIVMDSPFEADRLRRFLAGDDSAWDFVVRVEEDGSAATQVTPPPAEWLALRARAADVTVKGPDDAIEGTTLVSRRPVEPDPDFVTNAGFTPDMGPATRRMQAAVDSGQQIVVSPNDPVTQAVAQTAIGAPRVRQPKGLLIINEPDVATMMRVAQDDLTAAQARYQTAEANLAQVRAEAAIPDGMPLDATTLELWDRYVGGDVHPTTLGAVNDVLESLDNGMPPDKGIGTMSDAEINQLRTSLLAAAHRRLDGLGADRTTRAGRPFEPDPNRVATNAELGPQLRSVDEEIQRRIVSEDAAPLDGWEGTQYEVVPRPRQYSATGEPLAPRILPDDYLSKLDDIVPGIADEIQTGRKVSWTQRVADTNSSFLMRALDHVVGARPERELTRAAIDRFTEELLAYLPDGMSLTDVELRRYRSQVRGMISHVHEKMVESDAGFGGFLGLPSVAKYRRVGQVPRDKLEAWFRAAIEEDRPAWLDRLLVEADASGQKFPIAEVWRRTDNRVRQFFAERPSPIASWVEATYSGRFGQWAHQQHTGLSALYNTFRFALDARWLALEKTEAFMLTLGKEGIEGVMDAWNMTPDRMPLAFGVDDLARQRTEWAWWLGVMDTGGWNRARERYIMSMMKRRQAREFPAILKEMADKDPVLSEMIRASGDTPDTWLAKLAQDMTIMAERGRFHSKPEMEARLKPYLDKGTISQKEYDDALARGYWTDIPSLDAEIAYAAGTPVQPLLERLAFLNQQYWQDSASLIFGQVDRSNLQRLFNHPLLYWPISYQIKATKWLGSLLFEQVGGYRSGALGAVTLGMLHEQHKEWMRTVPGYGASMGANRNLLFMAQMILPITPWDMGVSLSPFTRLALSFITGDGSYTRNLFGVGPGYTYFEQLPRMLREQSQPGSMAQGIPVVGEAVRRAQTLFPFKVGVDPVAAPSQNEVANQALLGNQPVPPDQQPPYPGRFGP